MGACHQRIVNQHTKKERRVAEERLEASQGGAHPGILHGRLLLLELLQVLASHMLLAAAILHEYIVSNPPSLRSVSVAQPKPITSTMRRLPLC